MSEGKKEQARIIRMEGPRKVPGFLSLKRLGYTITAEDVNNHFSGLIEALRKDEEGKGEDGKEQES